MVKLWVAFISMMLFAPLAFSGVWIDDFSGGKIDEWEVVNAVKGEVIWQIDDGEAVGSTLAPHRFPTALVAGEVGWNNYTMSCDVKVIEPHEKHMSVGIVFHLDWAIRTFYVFEFVDSRDEASLTKITRNGGRTLGRIPFRLKVGKWYKFKVSIDEDGVIECSVDGDFIVVEDNDPIPNGKVGFAIGAVRARFDNLKVEGDSIQDGGPAPVRAGSNVVVYWGDLKKEL